MRIANYLRPDCVALRQRADSLQGAVQQLVALLDGAKVLTDTAVFAADVRARLELGGVCVGNGLAIPHAKSTAVEKLQLAALTLDPPLPCDTPDGQPLERPHRRRHPGPQADQQHRRDEGLLLLCGRRPLCH